MVFEHTSPYRKALIITFATILIVGVAFIVIAQNKEHNEPEPVACTMDAKICPDGSAVGRVAPDCEFAECPSGSPEDTSSATTTLDKETAIESYLLTQKNFSWKTKDNSKNFCTIEYLGGNQDLFPVYVWSYCSEYRLEGTDLVTYSSSCMPSKISYPNELSFYDIERFSYEAPRDGALYTEDVQTIFPEELWPVITEFNHDEIIMKNEHEALAWFSSSEAGENNLWNTVVEAIQNCEVSQVGQSHSKEVTITYKDGRELTAFEPNIDDVFDVTAQAKDNCGEIIMMTE